MRLDKIVIYLLMIICVSLCLILRTFSISEVRHLPAEMSLRKIGKHAIQSWHLSLVSLQNAQIFRLLLKISVEGNTQMSISEFLTATDGGLMTDRIASHGQLTVMLDGAEIAYWC